jgi:hypothetical protein
VSVLLGQPHGFEGVLPLLVKAAMHDAPVANRQHGGRAHTPAKSRPGVAINQPGGIVYEMRGGKIVHGRSFLSHGEALEAARHAEQDAHADP